MKPENISQVMEKFTTILAIGLVLTATLSHSATAGCVHDVATVEARVRGEQDWLRRETVLALIAEARRDATRGREAACVTLLDRARAQLRQPRH